MSDKPKTPNADKAAAAIRKADAALERMGRPRMAAEEVLNDLEDRALRQQAREQRRADAIAAKWGGR